MDRLHAMAAFAAVCDAGGFAPAARRLRVAPSAVTRMVAGLEAHLGVRLLHRTTRSVRLTDAGTRYLHGVRQVLDDLHGAEDAARTNQDAPRGHLVVSAPVIFGRMYVAPLVRDAMARHAGITVDLQLSDRFANLVEDGVDVAVRIGALASSGLVSRRVGETLMVVVAAPEYLHRRGTPEHPHDVPAHDTILLAPLQQSRVWVFAGPDGSALPVAIAPRLQTNSGDAALAVAREGGGLARTLLYQVLPDIAAGRLRTVLDAYAPPALPIHAVMATRRAVPARVRHFMELAADARWTFRLPG